MTELWAVHIPGVARLEPCTTRSAADACAADINRVLLQLEGAAIAPATVVRWPYSAQMHAAQLQSLSGATRTSRGAP